MKAIKDLTREDIECMTEIACDVMERMAKDEVTQNIMMQYIRIGMTPEQVRDRMRAMVMADVFCKYLRGV